MFTESLFNSIKRPSGGLKTLQIRTTHKILGQIKDGYYRRQGRLSRPIAVACEQCRQQQQQDDSTMYTNLVNWTPKQSNSIQPSRLTEQLQRNSFRGPFHPSDHYS